MKSFPILAAIALAGILTPSTQAAMFAMNDYDMESGSSMNDDLFGFGIDPTTWFLVQFTFTNVSFDNPAVGTFNLTGFDIFKDGTNAGGGTLVASTDPCTGIASPFPAVQTSIVCAVPLGVSLSETPYFVFPRAGSTGFIRHTTPGEPSTVELQGLPGGEPSAVPEPSAAALAGLGVAFAALLSRRRRRVKPARG